jgi:hypothetical protein
MLWPCIAVVQSTYKLSGMTSCSVVDVDLHFRGTCCLYHHSSTMMIEAAGFCESHSGCAAMYFHMCISRSVGQCHIICVMYNIMNHGVNGACCDCNFYFNFNNFENSVCKMHTVKPLSIVLKGDGKQKRYIRENDSTGKT